MSKNERSGVDYTALANVFPWPGRTVRRKRTGPTYERRYEWRTHHDGALESEVHGIEDGIADLKERGVWDNIPTKAQARGGRDELVLRLEHSTDYDIDWSYATVYRDEDGTLRLPERFDGDGPLGRKVPQRFHKALAKWQRQHEQAHLMRHPETDLFGYRIFTDNGPLNDRIFGTYSEAIHAAVAHGLETTRLPRSDLKAGDHWDVYEVDENGKILPLLAPRTVASLRLQRLLINREGA